MYDYTKSVQRGIQFLDKYAPEGWRDRIDWSKVSIISAHDCVAGQAFGSVMGNEGYMMSGWLQASDILWGLHTDDTTQAYETSDYGFNFDWEDDDASQDNLVNTWKRELGVKA